MPFTHPASKKKYSHYAKNDRGQYVQGFNPTTGQWEVLEPAARAAAVLSPPPGQASSLDAPGEDPKDSFIEGVREQAPVPMGTPDTPMSAAPRQVATQVMDSLSPIQSRQKMYEAGKEAVGAIGEGRFADAAKAGGTAALEGFGVMMGPGGRIMRDMVLNAGAKAEEAGTEFEEGRTLDGVNSTLGAVPVLGAMEPVMDNIQHNRGKRLVGNLVGVVGQEILGRGVNRASGGGKRGTPHVDIQPPPVDGPAPRLGFVEATGPGEAKFKQVRDTQHAALVDDREKRIAEARTKNDAVAAKNEEAKQSYELDKQRAKEAHEVAVEAERKRYETEWAAKMEERQKAEEGRLAAKAEEEASEVQRQQGIAAAARKEGTPLRPLQFAERASADITANRRAANARFDEIEQTLATGDGQTIEIDGQPVSTGIVELRTTRQIAKAMADELRASNLMPERTPFGSIADDVDGAAGGVAGMAGMGDDAAPAPASPRINGGPLPDQLALDIDLLNKLADAPDKIPFATAKRLRTILMDIERRNKGVFKTRRDVQSNSISRALLDDTRGTLLDMEVRGELPDGFTKGWDDARAQWADLNAPGVEQALTVLRDRPSALAEAMVSGEATFSVTDLQQLRKVVSGDTWGELQRQGVQKLIERVLDPSGVMKVVKGQAGKVSRIEMEVGPQGNLYRTGKLALFDAHVVENLRALGAAAAADPVTVRKTVNEAGRLLAIKEGETLASNVSARPGTSSPSVPVSQIRPTDTTIAAPRDIPKPNVPEPTLEAVMKDGDIPRQFPEPPGVYKHKGGFLQPIVHTITSPQKWVYTIASAIAGAAGAASIMHTWATPVALAGVVTAGYPISYVLAEVATNPKWQGRINPILRFTDGITRGDSRMVAYAAEQIARVAMEREQKEAEEREAERVEKNNGGGASRAESRGSAVLTPPPNR